MTCSALQEVAFSVGDSLFLAREDGSNLRRLLAWRVWQDLQWSPDAEFLAFRYAVDGVLVMRPADGSAATAGAGDPAGTHEDVCCFRWSPATDQIVFESALRVPPPGRDAYELFIYDVGSASTFRLTNHDALADSFPGTGFPGDARWSPDGGRIAYSVTVEISESVDRRAIRLVNPDGSAIRQITDPPGSDMDPVWSPDGRRLAFSRTDANGVVQVFVVDTTGANLRQLTSEATGSGDWVGPVAWSSDGSRLAVQVGISGGSSTSLEIAMADGSAVIPLTDAGVPALVYVSPWSPDGSRIAWSERTTGDSGYVRVADADGTNVRTVWAGTGAPSVPHWSPSGSRVLVAGKRNGSVRLYTVNADGSGTAMLALPGTITGDVSNLFAWRP